MIVLSVVVAVVLSLAVYGGFCADSVKTLG
jgi:hypothetical protein